MMPLTGVWRPRGRQPRIFPLCLPEDRDITIGVFPQSQEILVSFPGLWSVSGHRQRFSEFPASQRANWITADNAAVIEDLLEFHGGFAALVLGQLSLAPHIDRIKGADETVHLQ